MYSCAFGFRRSRFPVCASSLNLIHIDVVSKREFLQIKLLPNMNSKLERD